MQKIRVARVHASAWAVLFSFLITAAVFYLATVSVRDAKEKTPDEPTAVIEKITKDVTLKGGEYALLHFGAFDTASDARVATARYGARGAAGAVLRLENRYYAVGNAYSDAEEARKAAESLARQGIFCGLYTVSARDAVVRLTATEARADDFAAAYRALLNAESALESAARHLDADGISPRQARTHLLTAAYDLQSARERFSPVAGGDAVCAALTSLLDGAIRRVLPLTTGNENARTLSARAKFELIECAMARMRFLRGESL